MSDKIETITYTYPDGTISAPVIIITHNDGSQTSMLKTAYDAQQTQTEPTIQ